MKRKGFITVLAIFLVYFGYVYMQDEQYEQVIYDTEAKTGFTAVNYEIQRLIIRSFQPLNNGPTGVDDLKGQVEGVMHRVDWVIKDMEEEMNVPKEYKKAHQELLTAYKSFQPFLTDYQKEVQQAIEQEAIDSPSAQQLNDAYQQISLAAEQWYTIYKKRNNDDSSEYKEAALGSLQDQLVYEDYLKQIVMRDLQSIEGTVLSLMEEKNVSDLDKMLSNQQHILPRTVAYLEHAKVAEPYEKEHQNLLDAYTSLYSMIENVDVKELNDEYFQQFKAHYEELLQTFVEWDLVLEKQAEKRRGALVSELSEEEVAKNHYAKTNYDIQQLLIRSYRQPIAGPGGIDNLKVVVDNVKIRLNEVIKEMKERKVPEKYEQAHQGLLAAYQNFLPFLSNYEVEVQKAIEQESTTPPSNQPLNEAYLQISEAAEQWYKIYKESNNGLGQIDVRSALGNLQERLVYEAYVQEITFSELTDIEKLILPYVERKDYDGVSKMQSGQKNSLPSKIAYLKQTKVPEVYEKVHQKLLSTYTDYYNLITNVDNKNINDDYLEKLTAQYEALKKAVDAWNQVHLEELGHW